MIKRLKEYYKQLYTNKFDVLEEMNQFLKNHKYLKLTQDEIDNMSHLITIKDIYLTHIFKPQKGSI